MEPENTPAPEVQPDAAAPAEPPPHDPEAGLAMARSIVGTVVPLQIRASMMSYCMKIMIQAGAGNEAALAEYQYHIPRMAALDQWEEDMLTAGKSGTPWPLPPEWLADYCKDF